MIRYNNISQPFPTPLRPPRPSAQHVGARPRNSQNWGPAIVQMFSLTAGVSLSPVWRWAEVCHHSDVPALRVNVLWRDLQRKSRRLLHVRTTRFSLLCYVRHKTRMECAIRHHQLQKRIAKVQILSCSHVLCPGDKTIIMVMISQVGEFISSIRCILSALSSMNKNTLGLLV